MSSAVTELKDHQGLPWVEVQFDAEDGAIEFVKSYQPLTDEWLHVESESCSPILMAKIEEAIAAKMTAEPFDPDVEYFKLARGF